LAPRGVSPSSACVLGFRLAPSPRPGCARSADWRSGKYAGRTQGRSHPPGGERHHGLAVALDDVSGELLALLDTYGSILQGFYGLEGQSPAPDDLASQQWPLFWPNVPPLSNVPLSQLQQRARTRQEDLAGSASPRNLQWLGPPDPSLVPGWTRGSRISTRTARCRLR
jgi:hypothetical protein